MVCEVQMAYLRMPALLLMKDMKDRFVISQVLHQTHVIQ